MTLSIEQVEADVVRLSMSGWRGRAVGYTVSAYVLRGVLVDTGFPGIRSELMQAVTTLAPRGGIVTHWHEDHAGNVPELAASGLPLVMHAECERLLRERPSIRAYRQIVWDRPNALVAPVRAFDPAPLQIMATPGHTDDHIVAWDPERRIVVSGDLFLGVKVRVAHSHESFAALLHSLRAVAALEPRMLLDAHRGPVLNATTLLHAKIGWLDDTIGTIRALHDKGAGEREIQHRVLGAEPFVGWVSFGEYSKRSFVRAAIASGSPAASPHQR
ncbi:MAG: beta-lactamase domain protein [Gemmatimonadetes bacterium]|nr:beta-lactamase domain protein [Gemmatimonadota bacterium]